MTESDGTSLENDDSDNCPITLEKFREQYNEADQFTVRVSNYRDEVSIPAINELRYAGYHLLRAVSDDGHVVNPDQLRRGISHCQRARYDAAEAGIISALSRIQLFQHDYRKTVISDVVSNYLEILRTADDAVEMLEKPRPTDSNLGPIPDLSEMFDRISKMANSLDSARNEMNKKVRQDQRSYMRQIAGIFVPALIGAAIATMAAIKFFGD